MSELASLLTIDRPDNLKDKVLGDLYKDDPISKALTGQTYSTGTHDITISGDINDRDRESYVKMSVSYNGTALTKYNAYLYYDEAQTRLMADLGEFDIGTEYDISEHITTETNYLVVNVVGVEARKTATLWVTLGQLVPKSGGGGSSITMEDNPEGGVNLTVDGVTRNLAQYSDIVPERRMEIVADYMVEDEENTILFNLTKDCTELIIRIFFRCPSGQNATVIVSAQNGTSRTNFLAMASNANGDRYIVADIRERHGMRDVTSWIATTDSARGVTLVAGERFKDIGVVDPKPINCISISASSGAVIGRGTIVEVWGC